ncbi:MAG: complex I NDUFA9 subunit family protein, partial [Kiloniellales bacterium]
QNADTVAAAIAGADAVINLVGLLYERGRQTFGAVHVDGAKAIAEAAAAAGIKTLVHVSAIGASTDAEADYARSKGYGERSVRAAVPDAVICRPSLVIGPEDDFFNRFALYARLFRWLPLIGGGHTRFQPVYVGDVAEAIVRALGDPAARGQTYELGGPTIYSFRELMELLLAETGRRGLLVPVPYWLAEILATFLEVLPVPPLTRDQVRLLLRDNVVSEGAQTLEDLGVTATAIEVVLPTYLERHRPGGRADRLKSA